MKVFLIKIAYCAMATVIIGTAFAGTAPVPRSVTLNNEKQLKLAKNGIAECEIVIPDGSIPVTRFAAGELQSFLEQSTGTKVLVTNKVSTNKVALILGDNALSRSAGINVQSLPRDGFVIKAVGNRIYIAGRDDVKAEPGEVLNSGYWALMHERGTLFGVYGFLEQFVGVRFYFPGESGTIVPTHQTLTVPAMDIVERPDYTVRKTSYASGKWYDSDKPKDGLHEKNLNYYRARLETQYIPNCHGLARLGYLTRFGKSHPEYFALMSNGQRHNNPAFPHSGQLCLSSGIKEEIYQDAKAFLTGKSAKERGVKTARFGYCWDPSAVQPGYFNVMPQDSFYKCTCPKCNPHYSKGDQATSDFVWKFAVDIANRLKREGVPGYVTMMAYPPYRNLPNVKIPDNVLVMVAERGPWNESLPEIQAQDDREIADWVKKTGGKVWLWTYVNKYGGLDIPGIPNPTPRCIGSYFKRQAPNIFGAYLQSESDKFIFSYLNCYVFSKVAWDNSTDVDALLQEHYRLMFGPAADTMEKIYEWFEDTWVKKVAGKPVDTPTGPVCIAPAEYELWNKIYSPEEIASLTAQFDLAEKQAANAPAALKRVKFIRSNFLDTLVKTAQEYNAKKNEIADLTFNVKDVPAGEKITLDGKLDDPAWKNSASIFLTPYKPGTLPVKTTVRGLKDQDYLYFAFDCEEPEIKNIIAAKRDNDDKNIWKDSSVEIFLNPSGDRKKYYQLMVNAAGSLSDLQNEKIGSSNSGGNWNWNSDAIVKTVPGDGRWTAEIAIPIKTLPGFKTEGFPANFNRNRILSKSNDYISLYTWSPFLRNGFHDLQNFGSLLFGEVKDTSMLDNGDFSAPQQGRMMGKWYGPQDKYIQPGQSFSLDKTTSVKGGQSLKLTNQDTGKTGFVQYLPQMKPNTKYRVSFYVKTEDVVPQGRNGGACIAVWSDKNHFFPKNWYSGTMPWEKCTAEFVSGSQSNIKGKSYICLYLTNASGTAWFDDVKICEIK